MEENGSNNLALRGITGDCSFLGDDIFNVHLKWAVSYVAPNPPTTSGGYTMVASLAPRKRWLTISQALLKSRKHLLTSSSSSMGWKTVFSALRRIVSHN